VKVASFILTALLLVVLNCSIAVAVEVDELMPWLGLGEVELGMSYAEFENARPNAIALKSSQAERFDGSSIEEGPDGAKFIYSFLNGKLASVYWGKMDSADGVQTRKIREMLIKSHGPPMTDHTGQMDPNGNVAKVSREIYRSKNTRSWFVALTSTSRGVEVHAAYEAIYAENGKPMPLTSFEEVVKASANVSPPSNDKSLIVDVLPSVIADSEPPQPAQTPAASASVTPTPKASVPTQASSPTPMEVEEGDADVFNFPILPVAIVAAVIIGAVVFFVRRKSP